MKYTEIILEKQKNIAVLRLNRPERMNAVSEEMYFQLLDACSSIENDKAIRSLVLTGSVFERNGRVKQAFCAGADLKKHSSHERTHAQKRAYIELAHRATLKLNSIAVPVIAAVNGPARGAGSEIAINCDFILMSDEATIGFPETGLGTFVGGGATKILPGLIGMVKARELIYTGKILSGPEAVDYGMALASYPVEELPEKAMELAGVLSEKAPISMIMAKDMLSGSTDMSLENTLKLETDCILKCMDSEDWAEGVHAFNEKRKPRYRGE